MKYIDDRKCPDENKQIVTHCIASSDVAISHEISLQLKFFSMQRIPVVNFLPDIFLTPCFNVTADCINSIADPTFYSQIPLISQFIIFSDRISIASLFTRAD